MARRCSIVMQNLVERGQSVVFHFVSFFVTMLALTAQQLGYFNNRQRRYLQADLEIVSSVFSGKKVPFRGVNRFRNCCQLALRSVHKCPRKFSKPEKMGAKFVRTTSAIQKQGERKVLPGPLTSCIVDVHPYKIFKLPRYRYCQFLVVVPKAHGRANFCAH